MTARGGRPAVVLHIGEPKCGTTFVQHLMWRNRQALARAGVLLPGLHPQEHYRAQLDLRGVAQPDDDPTGSYAGEWDLLARQAVAAPRTAVISAEQLVAASAEQAARAVASLAGADVHVVVSLRDFASLLPAEWQETVKHRNRLTWPDWLARIQAGDTGDGADRARWFWQVHDTPEVLRRWGAVVPADRLHIVTLPRPGAPRALLWQRFAGVLGVDPAIADLGAARPNESLGFAEAEVMRRVNVALGMRDVGPYAYRAVVKERLAHGYLAQRPATLRPQLPAEVEHWAAQRSAAVVDAITAAGFAVAGDLDELRPAARPAAPGHRAGAADPVIEAPSEAVLDTAVGALAAVLHLRHDPHTPGAEAPGVPVDTWIGSWAGDKLPAPVARAVARLADMPRLRRAVRDLSSRYPRVGRLRVRAWRLAAGIGGRSSARRTTGSAP